MIVESSIVLNLSKEECQMLLELLEIAGDGSFIPDKLNSFKWELFHKLNELCIK